MWMKLIIVDARLKDWIAFVEETIIINFILKIYIISKHCESIVEEFLL
jgi:hypothetical protein